MGYNTSREVCVRNKDVLKQILEKSVNGESFTVPTRKKNRAYQIREALEAVKHHDDFKAYAHLDGLYRIKQRRTHVELQYIGEDVVPTNLTQGETTHDTGRVGGTSQVHMETDNNSRGDIPASLHLESVLDLLGVISAAVKLGERSDELFFPDANLPEEDKTRLWIWCKAAKWKYIDHEGAGLTLTRRDVDNFLLWEPQEVSDGGGYNGDKSISVERDRS